MENRDFRIAYSARMAAEDVGEIDVFSEIVSGKWSRDEPGITSKEFKEAVDRMKGARRLNVRINSPGGAVDQAVAMRGILAEHGAQEKHVYINGMCASAATIIACLPGATVHMTEGSEYMIHRPVIGQYGNSDDMRSCAERLENMEGQMRAIYAKRCGRDEEKIRNWMNATTWFTAKQAMENGFVDEVADAEKPVAAMNRNDAEVMRAMYGALPEAMMIADEAEERKGEDEMDLNGITMEMLESERGDLIRAMMERGAQEDRKRCSEIDEMTMPGYEDLAAQAKASGESAMDFYKRMVRAQKEKAASFMDNRARETAPANRVSAGDADDEADDKREMDALVREMKAYAEAYRGEGNSMF